MIFGKRKLNHGLTKARFLGTTFFEARLNAEPEMIEKSRKGQQRQNRKELFGALKGKVFLDKLEGKPSGGTDNKCFESQTG